MPRSRISKVATYGSDSAERRVAKVINESWPVLEGFTGTNIAHEMIRQGNTEALINAMPWDNWMNDVGGVVDPMATQVANSLRDQMRNFQGMSAEIRFDIVDSLSVRYARTQSSQLIKNLSDSQRDTVRQVMSESLQGNLTVDQAARRIRSTIGLHPAWAKAVVKYEGKQYRALVKTMDAAKAADTAAKRALRYKESLTRKRALMVARTEVHISSGLGRLAANKTAIDHGFAGNDSRKEWSAGPNACKICSGLSGEVTKWDQPYSNGEVIAHGHPGCRCADVFMPAEYGDAELDPQMENWLDDPQGFGSSNFGLGGLSNVATLAPVVMPAPVAVAAVPTSPYVQGKEIRYSDEEMTVLHRLAFEGDGDGDAALRRIYADQGFDGLPETKSMGDYTDMRVQGATQLFRGVDEAKYIKQFEEGEYFAGRGIHGSGTYMSTSIDTAKVYSDQTDNISKMVLRPDAKVIDEEDLRRLRDEDFERKMANKTYSETKEYLDVFGDAGRWAASKGYDAIVSRMAGPFNDDYFIVLNRTALIRGVKSGDL